MLRHQSGVLHVRHGDWDARIRQPARINFEFAFLRHRFGLSINVQFACAYIFHKCGAAMWLEMRKLAYKHNKSHYICVT